MLYYTNPNPPSTYTPPNVHYTTLHYCYQVAKQFYENPSTGMLYPCSDYPACPDCPMQLSVSLSLSQSENNPNPLCSPLPEYAKCGSCNAVRVDLYNVPPEKLVVPVITRKDFEAALSKAHRYVRLRLRLSISLSRRLRLKGLFLYTGSVLFLWSGALDC